MKYFRWIKRLFRRERLIIFPPDMKLLDRGRSPLEESGFMSTPEQRERLLEEYGDSLWDDSREVMKQRGEI